MTLSSGFYKQHKNILFLMEQMFPNIREKTTIYFQICLEGQGQYYITESKSMADWMIVKKWNCILFIL